MIKRLLFLVILGTYFLPTYCLGQYQVPKDSRYWKYHNWYLSNSIVNLVVSGSDQTHIEDSINELLKLKQKGIAIGDVVVIGLPNVKNGEGYEKLKQSMSSFSDRGLESSQALINKYDIRYSPTWIIRYQGKDYVYEGLKSPQTLFTSQGVFKNAE